MKKLIILIAALALGACASTSEEGKTRTTGQYIDDATVTAKVKTAIATDVGVRAASNVSVETNDGVVQLSGFADSKEQADSAEATAKKVGGVTSVKNDIRVKQ